MQNKSYEDFLKQKTHLGENHGFEPIFMPDFLFDFQKAQRVLPFKQSRDEEDEKHVHPLQLDVIDRVIVLWSNPGETILSPFLGVGSEIYGAICAGRKGIGIELKPSYFRQAKKNMDSAYSGKKEHEQSQLLAEVKE